MNVSRCVREPAVPDTDYANIKRAASCARSPTVLQHLLLTGAHLQIAAALHLNRQHRAVLQLHTNPVDAESDSATARATIGASTGLRRRHPGWLPRTRPVVAC